MSCASAEGLSTWALCPQPATTTASGSNRRSRSMWTISSDSPPARRTGTVAAAIRLSIAGAPIDPARGSAATPEPSVRRRHAAGEQCRVRRRRRRQAGNVDVTPLCLMVAVVPLDCAVARARCGCQLLGGPSRLHADRECGRDLSAEPTARQRQRDDPAHGMSDEHHGNCDASDRACDLRGDDAERVLRQRIGQPVSW